MKPIAWTDGKGNYFDENSFFPTYDLIPLYTHPVKKLTDEEIIKIADDPDLCNYDGSLRSCIDFARAILKKAQEK